MSVECPHNKKKNQNTFVCVCEREYVCVFMDAHVLIRALDQTAVKREKHWSQLTLSRGFRPLNYSHMPHTHTPSIFPSTVLSISLSFIIVILLQCLLYPCTNVKVSHHSCVNEWLLGPLLRTLVSHLNWLRAENICGSGLFENTLWAFHRLALTLCHKLFQEKLPLWTLPKRLFILWITWCTNIGKMWGREWYTAGLCFQQTVTETSLLLLPKLLRFPALWRSRLSASEFNM